jgi:hypothetical protein
MVLVRERPILTERTSNVGEVSANFCGKGGCRVVSATDPKGRILGFLDLRMPPYLLTYSVALVRKRTIPTERPPLVGELVPTSAVSLTDPYGRILGFLDRSCYVNPIDNTHYAPTTTTPSTRAKYSHKAPH